MAQNAQLPKLNIIIFSGGYTPASLHLVHGALRLGLPSSPIAIYATIGLGIIVPENEIYVTVLLGIFVLENYTWPLLKEWSRGDARMHPTYLEKLNLLLDVSHKFTLKNAKPICLKTIFSLFYINALRMSDSFANVMSSIYVLFASFLSLINK